MRFGGLIIAIIFAAVAAVIVLRMMAEQKPAATPQGTEQMKTVDVYVAAKPIPIGSVVTQDMIIAQPWPEHLVLPGFIRTQGNSSGDANANGSTAILGMVARAPFQQQEPIIASKLANPNDPNFLAGALPKGMRVMTIQTNETEGVAGFIFPGDHVDVLATHAVDKMISDMGGDGVMQAPHAVKENVTETVLTNVKVMAVDQRATNDGALDKNGKLLVPHSVTIMVAPADAQRVRLAEKDGTLSLALRALADKDAVDPLTLTTPDDVTQYKSAPAAGGGGYVTVYHGVKKDKSAEASAPVLGANPSTLPSVNPTPRVLQ